MQQHQLIQLCVDSMKMLVNQTKSDIEKIKGMIPSLFTEIGVMQEKVTNCLNMKKEQNQNQINIKYPL